MHHPFRRAPLLLLVVLSSCTVLDAQRRHPERHPPLVVFRGDVFIGGYFYDPAFGPYPWWPRPAYHGWYFPTYDRRAQVRVKVVPETTAVYVDGFYAGIVDDFNGTFQALPLPPGAHAFALYLPGYRTAHHNVYLRPGSTLKLHHAMERLPEGETSEPPPFAPPVPPPPAGSYRWPRTPPRVPPPTAPLPTPTVGYGTLELRVQPPVAEVFIDGQRWMSSDEGYFLVQIPAGAHRVEIDRPGYRRFSTLLDLREGETTPLNVSLVPTTR